MSSTVDTTLLAQSRSRLRADADSPDAPDDLARLAHAALELAVAPRPDVDRLQRLLRVLAPIAGASTADPELTRKASATSLPVARTALVTAAARLLDAPEPGALLERLLRSERRSVLLAGLAERVLPDASDPERAALQRLAGEEAGPEGQGTRLAEEARTWGGESDEALLDAHPVVRLFAVALRTTDAARSAERLLGLDASEFEELVAKAGRPYELPLEPDPGAVPSLEVLRARCRIHAELAGALGLVDPLAGRDELLAALRRISLRVLGSPAALAIPADGNLELLGLEDLAGRHVSARGDRHLGAAAFAGGAALLDRHPAAVLDRQIAARLGGSGLRAIPVCARQPLAVLYLDAATDAHGALALAAHLAAPLALSGASGASGAAQAEAGPSLHRRYERRLREIVHEANNPLAIVQNYLHLLGTKLDPESDGPAQVRRVRDEIRRASHLLREIVRVPVELGGDAMRAVGTGDEAPERPGACTPPQDDAPDGRDAVAPDVGDAGSAAPATAAAAAEGDADPVPAPGSRGSTGRPARAPAGATGSRGAAGGEHGREGPDRHEGVDANVTPLQPRTRERSGVRDVPPAPPATTDVNAIVEDVAALLRPVFAERAGIRLRTDLDPDAPALAADAGHLRQVLLNVLKNAAEAMEGGGALQVMTRSGIVSTAGTGLEIVITDSGPGIPRHLLPRLFEAGSSTRGSERGLGLHIVRQLVEGMGGTISAASREGVGTTFRILLPG